MFTFVISRGKLYSCGRNCEGQLGIGNNIDSNVFIEIPIQEKFIAVSCGETHTVAFEPKVHIFP